MAVASPHDFIEDCAIMASLRCIFLVQSEGRGHLTQALAMQQMLAQAGHRVVSTIVGQQAVPPFFRARMPAPIVHIPSPGFAVDSDQRGIEISRTLRRGVRRMARVPSALASIEAQLNRYQPDVVLNFFEPLAGLYWGLCRPSIPMVAIAHQYMFLHPAYRFPGGHSIRRRAVQGFARLTAWGAERRLALSLYPVPQADETPRLAVLPPLLRPEVFDLTPTRAEPFVLVYLLNRGYTEDVIRWHTQHPDVRLHCFVDRPEAPATETYDATLTFHQVDDQEFLSMMARCRGVVSTAGFESVAEAMVLGKPVQVVPVKGHFEQHCNALDTERAGAGCRSMRFDIDRLMDVLADYRPPGSAFRQWVAAGQERFVRAIEAAAGVQRASAPSVAAPSPVLYQLR